MFKTVSKPLAHLNFLSGVNCYDIGSTYLSADRQAVYVLLGS
jgi:hypothetical protein